MYIPKHNLIADRALLFELMRRYSFATLVTVHQGIPEATHLPFLVYPDVGEHGLLVSHMARANRQWEDFSAGNEVLVIFQGPHAYISPSWYETQPSVPTWNYMVVHGYGVPRLIQDDARIRASLGELVEVHEHGFDEPWRLDLPDEYLRKMERGIVAFEIPITRLEGKFKLNQNRSARDQALVRASLGADPSDNAQDMLSMMRQLAAES